MTEVIFRHEGTIDKFEGDAILAFFGAPQAHEDHAERALRVALEMREHLADLDDMWRERTQTSLRIGIGIHTGVAFVGNIGSQRRMDYTIIGDTVNLASRLQDLTKEFGVSILTSESTRAKVQDVFKFRSIGSIHVKGREQPVDAFEALDFASTSSTQGAADSGTPDTQDMSATTPL